MIYLLGGSGYVGQAYQKLLTPLQEPEAQGSGLYERRDLGRGDLKC